MDRTFQSGSESCFVYDDQMRIKSSRREPAEFEKELPPFPEDVITVRISSSSCSSLFSCQRSDVPILPSSSQRPQI